MKCKNECGKEAAGKGQYCGKSCRAMYSKRNRTSATIEAQPSAQSTPDVKSATLEDYQSPDGRQYATRAEPDRLNWGEWMDATQLNKAGLKANRVTIPGDWDYVGVCEQVDGVWRVSA